MSVGERIMELRKAGQLSQGQLAKDVGVSRQAVSKWENDLAYPDTSKLILLAEVLNTQVEYLATGRSMADSAAAPSPSQAAQSGKAERIVEKIVEKPVVRVVEKMVERPVVQVVEKIVEKPVVRKVYRYKYLRNPLEFVAVAIVALLIGLVLGAMLL